jgi:hypothetical protein
MSARHVQERVLLFLGVNLLLAFLALRLSCTLGREPSGARNAPPQRTFPQASLDPKGFPLRKLSLPLAEVRKRSEAFASRIDGPSAWLRFESAFFTFQPPATPMSIRPKRTALARWDLGLAGAALAKENKGKPRATRAPFEFPRSSPQSLLRGE